MRDHTSVSAAPAKAQTSRKERVRGERSLAESAWHPAGWEQNLVSLQAQLGNRYVQRVVALARAESDAPVVPEEVEERIQRAHGGGQPLGPGVRAPLESALGADLGGVRIHTGPEADALSRSLNARAFTTGEDVFFRQGDYQPDNPGGRELLAHELTHVLQQSGGPVQRKLTVGPPDDMFEQEANRVAKSVARGERTAEPNATKREYAPHNSGSGQGVLSSPAALQMQEDPSKGKQPAIYFGPVTFPELDVNPARGAMQRAQMQARQHAAGKKAHSIAEGWSSLFKALLDALERIDKSLTADATQSVGLLEYGKGTSSAGSTATKPSKDVVYLSSTGIDLAEVFEIMDLLVLSVSTPSEIFTKPEDLKEKPSEVLFEKFNAVKEALDEEGSRERANEESSERSTHAHLLQEIRELKEQVKVDLADFKAEGKPAALDNKTAAMSKAAGQAPQESKATSPKLSKPKNPKWYDHDPMGYWNSYPLVASFEGISGDPYSSAGAVAIVTDTKGTRRMFRYWFDKDGYERSELLKTSAP